MTHDLIARKGEIATCENGHEMFTIANDISPYGHARAEDFTEPRNGLAEPAPGMHLPVCPVCGGKMIRASGGHLQLHVGDEWRG